MQHSHPDPQAAPVVAAAMYDAWQDALIARHSDDSTEAADREQNRYDELVDYIDAHDLTGTDVDPRNTHHGIIAATCLLCGHHETDPGALDAWNGYGDCPAAGGHASGERTEWLLDDGTGTYVENTADGETVAYIPFVVEDEPPTFTMTYTPSRHARLATGGNMTPADQIRGALATVDALMLNIDDEYGQFGADLADDGDGAHGAFYFPGDDQHAYGPRDADA